MECAPINPPIKEFGFSLGCWIKDFCFSTLGNGLEWRNQIRKSVVLYMVFQSLFLVISLAQCWWKKCSLRLSPNGSVLGKPEGGTEKQRLGSWKPSKECSRKGAVSSNKTGTDQEWPLGLTLRGQCAALGERGRKGLLGSAQENKVNVDSFFKWDYFRKSNKTVMGADEGYRVREDFYWCLYAEGIICWG